MTKTVVVEDREVLDVEGLARYLGCGRTHAYGLLRDGSIPSFRIGRLRRVLLEDARRYVEERRSAEEGHRGA